MRASPRFKAVQEKKWEILTTILNSQRGGTKKTVEQWQKVYSIIFYFLTDFMQKLNINI